MPTSYTDQFFLIDPYSPPGAGTSMSVENYELIDNNDDGDIDRFNNDNINGLDVTSSWPGDTVTVQLADGSTVTYTGTTFNLAGGDAVFTPTDGQVLQPGTLVSTTFVTTQGGLDVGDLGPACFVKGTLIDTLFGPKPIQEIKVGDHVRTGGGGFQPVRWSGHSTVDGSNEHAPIRIKSSAFENVADVVVSPQHRILLRGWRAQLFFGEDEVLVPAKHLVNEMTVIREPLPEVTYYHLMLDGHEVLKSAGLWSESLVPRTDLIGMERGHLRDILSLETSGNTVIPIIRPVVRGRHAQAVLMAV